MWRRAATSPQVRRGGPWWWRRDDPARLLLAGGKTTRRQAAALAEQLQQAMQVQLLTAMQQQGAAGETVKLPGAAPATAVRWRSRPAWRFRKHVQPFAWLAVLMGAGAGLHAVPHGVLAGLIGAVLVPAGAWWAASQRDRDKKRYFSPWTRRFVIAEGVASGVWLPVLAGAGLRPCAAWVLLSWLPFLGLWVRRYRWRPADEPRVKVVAPDDDVATFAALCAEQKWRARLGPAVRLDGGGRRYPVQCDGIKTVMKKILAAPDNVAGAWHSPTTEVYAERDPKGITSRGYLTILPGNSLQETQWWDGSGMDPKTGLARIGRFADGSPAHIKLYTPRFGCRHDLDSGTTGSGKSGLLELKIFIALQSGWFVPIILDPQEGQSLPFWRGRCIYASGVSEVERRVRGLHAAFLDRSSQLATWRWSDNGVEMPGMPFFDYELLDGQLPIPWIILDEAHEVLKGDSKWQRQITAYVVEMARLIRKAGGKKTLATQLPGLADLGGSQPLRDMLRGGNVWSGRTANKVSGGMLGLVKDPSEIPRYFGDGSETAGLGYTDGPDNRPDAPMRTDRVGREHYRNPPPVRQLDDRFLEVMDRAMREAVSPTSTVAPVAGPGPSSGGLIPRPGSLQPRAAEAELVDDAPEGRRCVDAVLQVLTDSKEPMDRGDIIKWVGDLSKMWGRPKPWGIKMIQNTLRDLVASGQVVQPGGKGTAYQAVVRDSEPGE